MHRKPREYSSEEIELLTIKEIEEMPVEKAIARNFSAADENFQATELYSNFGSLLADIRESIINEISLHSHLEQKWKIDNDYPFAIKFYHGCYFLSRSKLAAEKGDTNKSWSLLNQSSILLSEAFEIMDFWYENIKKSKVRDRNTINGKHPKTAIQIKNLTMQEFFAAFLHEHRPHGGWKSKHSAIETLMKHIGERKKENPNISESNNSKTAWDIEKKSYSTIENWMKENENLRAAWEKYKAPKKTTRKQAN